MELDNFLLIGATYEIDVEKKVVTFTLSKEEVDSEKTSEIWNKVLTNDGRRYLAEKMYVYNPNTSLLARKSDGWTYVLHVPRIQSSGRSTVNHAKDTSKSAINTTQKEATQVRDEFETIMNSIL